MAARRHHGQVASPIPTGAADPSLASLLTLAAGAAAMAAVAISPSLRARLILLRPIPLRQRLLIHLSHHRRTIRASVRRLAAWSSR